MKKKFIIKTLSYILGASILMTGCTPLDHKRSIENLSDRVETNTTNAIKDLTSRNDINSPYVKKVNRPFIASKSTALSYDAALPSVFTKMVLRLPYKRYNITEIADIIQTETNIPVAVDLDTGGDDSASAEPPPSQANSTGNNLPDLVPLSATEQPNQNSQIVGAVNNSLTPSTLQEMELDHRGSLSSLLDKITARMGLTWEYNGREIKIQRFITRTFSIKTHLTNIYEETEIGNLASSKSDDGSKYKSNLSLKTESKYNALDDLMAQIKSMLSVNGKVVSNEGSMRITVTDKKSVIEKVEELINEHNAIMGRQIRLQVQVLKFTSFDNRDRSLDLNLIYRALADKGAVVREIASIVSPSSIASASAGYIGVSYGSGNWANSSVIMKALDDIGKTSEEMNRVLVTMNNKPAPISITREFSYISETTPGTISTTGSVTSSSVGIKQEKDTVGMTMFITPFITDANNVSLKLIVNKRVLTRMDTAESGTGDTKQQVQQPVIDGEMHQEYATVKPGETLLISGYETNSGNYDTRNTDSWTAFTGAGYSGEKKKESTIILVTPYIVDER